MINSRFNFEDLEVWQKAIDFADKVIEIIDNLETDRKHYRLIENIESAAVSVASNTWPVKYKNIFHRAWSVK